MSGVKSGKEDKVKNVVMNGVKTGKVGKLENAKLTVKKSRDCASQS